jgi:excisionase family DNA binding protein
MIDRPYRTAAEVANELGVSLRTVRRWVADGRLPATRVGRSVRIPVDSYRDARRIGEVAADNVAGAAAMAWPDTPERLAEQRRVAADLMDRLAAQGRPPTGPSDTADAILDAVRDEFGADRLQPR